MALKKETPFKTVIDGLNHLRACCEGRGKQGLFDLNVLAESFFCPFLNEAFDLDLNVLKTGHPGIDLGDAQAGVAFQITSEPSKTKVQETLTTYSTKKLFAKYPSLKVLIIGERKPAYTLTIPKGVAFDPATDIHDVHTLGAEIKAMGAVKVGRLADIVSAEIAIPGTEGKSAKSADALELSLNGKAVKLPETTCTYAPDAGWSMELVFHNKTGEVLEPGDFSVSFIIPDKLYMKDTHSYSAPVFKYPVRLSSSEILFELTQFNRLLPGARASYGVPLQASERHRFAVGSEVPIKVQVHTKYGNIEYPVKLAIVSDDDHLAAVQMRPAPANQAAIVQLNSFVQTLEAGTKNLPALSWKRAFGSLDPECATLSKKQIIQRLFSTTDHAKLVLYLGAVRGMYSALIQRRDVRPKYEAVCLAFGVSYAELI